VCGLCMPRVTIRECRSGEFDAVGAQGNLSTLEGVSITCGA
jgi:hypothetical protein